MQYFSRVSSTGTGNIHVRSSRCWGPQCTAVGQNTKRQLIKRLQKMKHAHFDAWNFLQSPDMIFHYCRPLPNLCTKIISISFPSPSSPSELPFYTSCSNSCDQGFPVLLLVELMLTNVKATFALVIIILSASWACFPFVCVHTSWEFLQNKDPNPNPNPRTRTQRSKVLGFVL